MQPSQTLPPGYRAILEIDLQKNIPLALALNLIALGFFITFGWAFSQLAALAREDFRRAGALFDLSPAAGLALMFVLLAVLVLHEAVHGVFFWLFTRSRPQFAFKFLYAYAAAPGWYLPRNRYAIVGLAPLVVISLAGWLLIPWLPFPAALLAWYAITFNAGGAAGDLLIVAWLLTRPAAALINDRGDAVTIYLPAPQAQPAA
jgi:hypothetical protein